MSLLEEKDMSCPFCNSKKVYMIKEEREMNFNRQRIEYEDIHYFCMKCMGEFDTGKSFSNTAKKIREKYEKEI